MIDLFPQPAFLATRSGRDYEFTANGRVTARTTPRSVDAKHWGRYLLRLLGSSGATRHAEIEIRDASDVVRYVITLDAGTPNRFAANLHRADGTALGRAAADGGTFSPFPKIELTDPAGRRLGYATSDGAPQVFGPDDQLIASLIWTPEAKPFAKPAWTLQFPVPGIPADIRALIVAGLIAWELPR